MHRLVVAAGIAAGARPIAIHKVLGVDTSSSILAQLMAVIEDRKANPSEKSYTHRLLSGGIAKIGSKVTEEAAEVVEAAGEPGAEGQAHTVREAADVIYHLWVLLAARDIALGDVEAELARRFGISGLEEKASRPPKGSASDPTANTP